VPVVDVHPGVPLGVAGLGPAQWAEPPSIPNIEPTVPTPDEVRALIDEAERGKRPEMARAILVAATTGLRRAELSALRRDRDLDLERGLLRVTASVAKLPGAPMGEIPTKNRRRFRADGRVVRAVSGFDATFSGAELSIIPAVSGG
jgi:integrase